MNQNITSKKSKPLTLNESDKYENVYEGSYFRRPVLKLFNYLMALQKKKKKGRAKSDYIHRDFL